MTFAKKVVNEVPEVPEVKAFIPKIKRLVTLPLLKLAVGKVAYVRIEEPMYTGKAVDDKEAAILCKVTNLETGELSEIILPTVLRSIFTEEFPDDGYVGKGFSIELVKVDGKKYHQIKLAELEL